MRLLAIDIETTGLDHVKDHATEIAWVIKDHRDPKPVDMQSHFVTPPEDFFDLSPEIRQLTKITMGHLRFGKPLEDVMRWLADSIKLFEVDAVVAHNGEGFDKPFLQAKSQGFDPSHVAAIFERQWIDSSVDCVFPPDCRHNNLLYVAAFYGFLNPFPHAALFDSMTAMKIVDQFDIGPLWERAQSPWVYVMANVSYNDRDKAKARRYYWETHGMRTFPKTWVKRVKRMDLAKEQTEAGFPVVVLD